jgi:hypothetical protein
MMTTMNLVVCDELLDILLERVDPWNQQEDQQHHHRDQRHQEGAPELSHGAVDTALGIPVRGNTVWHHRVDPDCYQKGRDDERCHEEGGWFHDDSLGQTYYI